MELIENALGHDSLHTPLCPHLHLVIPPIAIIYAKSAGNLAAKG